MLAWADLRLAGGPLQRAAPQSGPSVHLVNSVRFMMRRPAGGQLGARAFSGVGSPLAGMARPMDFQMQFRPGMGMGAPFFPASPSHQLGLMSSPLG